jgi:hypothetical protein
MNFGLSAVVSSRRLPAMSLRVLANRLAFFSVTGVMLLALTACPDREASPAASTVVNPPNPRAFFFWKRRLSLTNEQRALLSDLQVTRLYVRLFDLRWDRGTKRVQPTPALVIDHKTLPKTLELVAAVFITQKVLRELQPAQLEKRARALLARSRRVLGKRRWSRLRELMIDCDWSPATRSSYFALLEKLRANLAKRIRLTATLRLHQLRHRKENGIPPVERVMLMFYNVRPPARFSSKNALVDKALIAGYLETQTPYPLEVDVALGIFSWAAHFNADHGFLRLIRDVTRRELRAQPGAFSRKQGTLYVVKKKTHLEGVKLLSEDLLRLDEHRYRKQLELAHLLVEKRQRFAKKGRFTTSLYHFDKKTIARFCRSEKPAPCLAKLFVAATP